MSMEVAARRPFAASDGNPHSLNDQLDINISTTVQAPTYLDYRTNLDNKNSDTSVPLTTETPPGKGHSTLHPTTEDNAKPPNSNTAEQERPESLDGPKTPHGSPCPAPSVFLQGGNTPPSRFKRGLRPRGKTARSSTSSENTIPTTPLSRSTSFKGIQTSIPSGDLEDPFGPNKINVSKQGSVRLIGEKFHSTAHSEQPRPDIATTSFARPTVAPLTEINEKGELGNESIFSTDSQRQSQRVRSLYESGIEFPSVEMERPASAIPLYQKDNPREDTLGELRPTNLSPRFDSSIRGPRSVSAMSSQSSFLREPGETAGGAEDWTDVDAEDVDRYGFIARSRSAKPKRVSLVQPTVHGFSEISRGQRPLTSLGVIDETAPTISSSTRTPDVIQPNRNTRIRPSSSVMSISNRNSSISRINAIRSSRSQQRRLVAEASTMLNPWFGRADGGNISESRAPNSARTTLELRRSMKWLKMANIAPTSSNSSAMGAGTNYYFNTKDPKLISRTWKGIPDRWRATAWRSFLTTSAAHRSSTGRPEPSDSMLIKRFHDLQDIDCPDDVQIDLDVPRTVGQHIMFRKRYRGGQRLLFRVLRALALHFPDIGYVQGMAAIVSTLLCYFDEELAFVLAVRMWTLRGVAWLYTGGFDGLMEALEDFESDWLGIGDKGQALKNRLQGLGVSATVWGTKWYLTLFNYSLPFQTQLRIWDVLLLLGDSPPPKSITSSNEKKSASPYPKANLDVVHAVAAALLLGMRDRLLEAEFEVAMEYLTGMIAVADGRGEDVLMGLAKALMKQKAK